MSYLDSSKCAFFVIFLIVTFHIVERLINISEEEEVCKQTKNALALLLS